MVDDMVDQFASPRFDFMVNVFDGLNASCLRSLQHPRLRRHITVHHEPAFKPLYWKRFVTPEATRQYDLMILTDGDVRFDAHLGFTLAEVEFWLRRTRAAMLQPNVAAAAQNLRSGSHGLAPTAFTADCAAVAVDTVERVYVARQPAYETLWRALSEIPDEYLQRTDTDLEMLWCKLVATARPSRPACVRTHAMTALHFDTRLIRRQGHDKYFLLPAHADKKTKVFLRRRWPQEMSPETWRSFNWSVPLGTCWSVLEPKQSRLTEAMDALVKDREWTHGELFSRRRGKMRIAPANASASGLGNATRVAGTR